MRVLKLGVAVATSVLATMSVMAADDGAQSVPASAADQFVANDLTNGDWSKAEAALLNTSFADEDEVFAKLNLAFVYSTTGRKDMAVALYRQILASSDNPYALTVSGQPRRVKTIAKVALNRLAE